MSDLSALPLRSARMRAQRLTDATRLGTDPAAITRAIVAAQAQSFDAARHQLRVRSTGLSAVEVDRAFEHERSVVRTWLMRGTLHLCAADDLRWMLDVLGPNSNRLGASRRIGLGLDDATCRRGVSVLRKALAHGPLARRQLRERLVAAGVIEEPVGQRLIHLLFHAATLGVICSGPRMGRDDSFVLLDDWVPASGGPRGEAALVELACRYLAAYGPASVADFAAWSGLPSGMAKLGMAGIGPGMLAFPGAVPALWTLGPVAPEARSGRPVVRLLGHFDTFLLGYRRREHVGDAAAEAWIHQGGGGWIRPVICVDGWIVAGWRLDSRGSGFEITVIPFVPLSGRIEAGIDREAVSISAFLERPVRWTSEALVG
jgi:Winged helix DNA-binding domain